MQDATHITVSIKKEHNPSIRSFYVCIDTWSCHGHRWSLSKMLLIIFFSPLEPRTQSTQSSTVTLAALWACTTERWLWKTSIKYRLKMNMNSGINILANSHLLLTFKLISVESVFCIVCNNVTAIAYQRNPFSGLSFLWFLEANCNTISLLKLIWS